MLGQRSLFFKLAINQKSNNAAKRLVLEYRKENFRNMTWLLRNRNVPCRKSYGGTGMSRSAFGLPLVRFGVIGIGFQEPLCSTFLYISQGGQDAIVSSSRSGLSRHARAARKKTLLLCLNGADLEIPELILAVNRSSRSGAEEGLVISTFITPDLTSGMSFDSVSG